MKNSIITCIFFISFACNTPKTKASYLRDYQQFITEVKNDWKHYSRKDWEHKTEINRKYKEDYYKQFVSEMSSAEIVRVKRFHLAFLFYKGELNIQELLSGKYNDVLQNQLKDLQEVNMELLKGIEEMSNEKYTVIINRLLQ